MWQVTSVRLTVAGRAIARERSMPPEQPAGFDTCALCHLAITPGDKVMFRQLPDKGLVRVHVLCYVKAQAARARKATPGS